MTCTCSRHRRSSAVLREALRCKQPCLGGESSEICNGNLAADLRPRGSRVPLRDRDKARCLSGDAEVKAGLLHPWRRALEGLSARFICFLQRDPRPMATGVGVLRGRTAAQPSAAAQQGQTRRFSLPPCQCRSHLSITQEEIQKRHQLPALRPCAERTRSSLLWRGARTRDGQHSAWLRLWRRSLGSRRSYGGPKARSPAQTNDSSPPGPVGASSSLQACSLCCKERCRARGVGQHNLAAVPTARPHSHNTHTRAPQQAGAVCVRGDQRRVRGRGPAQCLRGGDRVQRPPALQGHGWASPAGVLAALAPLCPHAPAQPFPPPPMPCCRRRTPADFVCNLLLADTSTDGMQRPVEMLVFAPSDVQLPRPRRPGDIIRLHRVKVACRGGGGARQRQGTACCCPAAAAAASADAVPLTFLGVAGMLCGMPCRVAGAAVQQQAAVLRQGRRLCQGRALRLLPLRLRPRGAAPRSGMR